MGATVCVVPAGSSVSMNQARVYVPSASSGPESVDQTMGMVVVSLGLFSTTSKKSAGDSHSTVGVSAAPWTLPRDTSTMLTVSKVSGSSEQPASTPSPTTTQTNRVEPRIQRPPDSVRFFFGTSLTGFGRTDYTRFPRLDSTATRGLT